MGDIWIPGKRGRENENRFTHFPPKLPSFPPKPAQRTIPNTTTSKDSFNSAATKTTPKTEKISTTTYFPPTDQPLPTYVIPSETLGSLPLESEQSCTTQVLDKIYIVNMIYIVKILYRTFYQLLVIRFARQPV